MLCNNKRNEVLYNSNNGLSRFIPKVETIVINSFESYTQILRTMQH